MGRQRNGFLDRGDIVARFEQTSTIFFGEHVLTSQAGRRSGYALRVGVKAFVGTFSPRALPTPRMLNVEC
jgi:hypothetical protein